VPWRAGAAAPHLRREVGARQGARRGDFARVGRALCAQPVAVADKGSRWLPFDPGEHFAQRPAPLRGRAALKMRELCPERVLSS